MVSLSQEFDIRNLFHQFFKFALVGVMNTGVDLTILNMEMLITQVREGTGYAIQKGFSFLVAVIFSYFMNKYWTFQYTSKELQSKKFFQFIFISIIGMVINVSTATSVITYLKPLINPWLNLSILTGQLWGNIGALCGTAVGLILNFIGYRWWVFNK